MRRISLVLMVLLLLAVSALAQVSFSVAPISYMSSSSAVDQHGNLLVFDTTYSLTVLPATTSGAIGSGASNNVMIPFPVMPVRQVVTPKTRITVLPGGTGQPVSKEYPATFQIIGTGEWALYAAATAYTLVNNQPATGARKLIAIDPGVAGTALPADFSGFLNTDLTTGEVKLNASRGSAPDVIFNVDSPGNPITLKPLSPTIPVSVRARIARTIKFDGTRFTSTDVALPQ